MRLLMANEEWSPRSGSGRYVLSVREKLEALGYEVAVLHGDGRAAEEGVPGESYFLPGLLGFEHTKSASALAGLERALEAARPEVIYLHQVLNPRAVEILTRAAPSFRYVHGIRLTCPTGRRLPRTWDGICEKPFDALCLVKAYTQKCMPRRPDTALRVWGDVAANRRANRELGKLLVASGFVRELFIRNGFPPDLVEVLPYYTELTPQAESNRPAPERRLLCVSRLDPEKGVQHVLEALELLREPVELEVAGDGPFEGELRKMATQLPARHAVRFHGWLGEEELSALYRRARLVVVPSTSPETFGIVGIEAMAHGLPVVAFDVGGIGEWLEEGRTGFLVPRKDIPTLAERMERLLSDEGLCLRMGEAGREAVRRRFLPGPHMARLCEVIEEVASARRAPSATAHPGSARSPEPPSARGAQRSGQFRIALLCPHYPPNATPCGVGDYSRELVREMVRAGAEVTVLADEGYSGPSPSAEGAMVLRLGRRDWARPLAPLLRHLRGGRFDAALVEYAPTLYPSPGALAASILLLRGLLPQLPIVTAFHTIGTSRLGSKIGASLLLLASHALISTNREVTSLVEKHLPRARRKLAEIPIGSNIFPPPPGGGGAEGPPGRWTDSGSVDRLRAEVREELGLPAGGERAGAGGVVAHFGFYYPGKGAEELLEAAAVLHRGGVSFRLLLLGGVWPGADAYYRALQSRGEKLGIGGLVRWTGYLPPAQLSRYLLASDVCCLPYEGGLSARRGSLMAALAHGLPVVAPPPRLAEPLFRAGENYWPCPSGDPRGIGEAIRRVLEDSSLRERLARGSLALAEEFDWARIARAHLEFLQARFGRGARSHRPAGRSGRAHSVGAPAAEGGSTEVVTPGCADLGELGRAVAPRREEGVRGWRGAVKGLSGGGLYLAWRLGGLGRPRPRLAGPGDLAELEARRILFIQLNSLGDLVMTLPVLSSLRARYPGASIDALVQPHLVELLETHPAVGRAWGFDRHLLRTRPHRAALLRGAWRTLRALRERGHDLAVDFTGLFPGAWVAWASRAGLRLGFRRPFRMGWARPGSFGYLLTHEVEGSPGGHVADEFGALLAALGAPPPGGSADICITPEDRRRARDWREARGVAEGPLAVLAPGAKWPPRRWPEERFGEVAKGLRREGWRVVAVGSGEERGLLAQVARAAGSELPIAAGELRVRELAALLADSQLFVGNDSGPLHLAAAVGTPRVALFGPTSPSRTAPRREEGQRVLYAAWPCSPCTLYFSRDRCERGTNECLQAIGAEEVLRAAREVAGATAHPGRARSPEPPSEPGLEQIGESRSGPVAGARLPLGSAS